MAELLKQHSKRDVAQSEVGTSDLKEDNDDNAMQRYVKRWRRLQSVGIGGEEEEQGRAWQHSLPFKIEHSVCSAHAACVTM